MRNMSDQLLQTGVRLLLIFAAALTTLLLVRAFVYARLSYTPLPFAEPLAHHLFTVVAVGSASALAGLLQRGRWGTVYSALSAFTAYLVWAIIQQNLIIHPELWKLWERGWLTVAIACGLVALVLAGAIRLIGHRVTRQAGER